MNDYTIMAIEEQMSMCQELGATLLNQLNSEHQYIMECYEEGVVLEADNVADTRPKKSLWQRIKDFFARIFGLYKNKTEDMVAKNNQFLKEIKPLILTGSMDGLTLEVLDFNSTQKMADISNSIINKIKSVRDKSKEDANKILDEIEKTHGNGEGFASGLKSSFLNKQCVEVLFLNSQLCAFVPTKPKVSLFPLSLLKLYAPKYSYSAAALAL
jgi:gas vesicle protein